MIAGLQEKLLVECNCGPEAHAYSRPASVEGEATNRAITIADAAGVPVYIVHTSSEDAHEAIAMDGLWRYVASAGNINPQDPTGVPEKAKSAERTIMSVVRNLCRELDGECTTIQVYNAGTEQGFDEETVDRVLNNMRNRGDLYQPRIGLWRMN